MHVNVTITMRYDRIAWVVIGENNYRATGADPLLNAGGDYMVLLSNVVNMLNGNYVVDNWDFIRG